MKITMKKVKDALRTILGNRASGVYSVDELKQIRENETARNELSREVAGKMTETIWDREDFKNAKWWKKLWLFAVDGLSNKCGEGHIPEDILHDLTRLLLPQIIQMYESEEGKKQLEEWKAEQEKQKEIVAAESKSECAKRP